MRNFERMYGFRKSSQWLKKIIAQLMLSIVYYENVPCESILMKVNATKSALIRLFTSFSRACNYLCQRCN
ncbi:hypothetical protein [uncultured Methanobrevibacter sp.]|uniref:hypothetical protein n=1 Tax=uncultured Methanobrevibacter sp. TaxID=253161 RepID=UPI00263800C0